MKRKISFIFVLAFLLIKEFVTALSDPWNAGIVIQTFTIGGLIALISVMGDTRAVAERLSRRGRSRESRGHFHGLASAHIFS
jgi:hypothetical protein